MRIRTIKPEFFLHDKLFDAEKETRLPLRVAFIGLWCAADREGRFRWEPRRLGAAILPYDGVDFSRVLDALATRGFVVRYASDGIEFGCIPTFSRHQVVNNRETQSTIPPPPDLNEIAGLTREPRVDHACVTPLVHAQAEGNGREGEGNNSSTTRKTRSIKAFIPPTLEEVLSYCAEKWPDWHPSRVKGAWEFFDVSEWHTAKGERVLNWKTKFLNLHANAVENGRLSPTREWLQFQQEQQSADQFARRAQLIDGYEDRHGI